MSTRARQTGAGTALGQIGALHRKEEHAGVEHGELWIALGHQALVVVVAPPHVQGVRMVLGPGVVARVDEIIRLMNNGRKVQCEGGIGQQIAPTHDHPFFFNSVVKKNGKEYRKMFI